MEPTDTPVFIGIDASKGRLDVAVRPGDVLFALFAGNPPHRLPPRGLQRGVRLGAGRRYSRCPMIREDNR